VTLPSAPSKHAQEEYEKLNRLSGADFDREYLAYMQKDHHKDLAEFRQEEATVTDPTLKDAVIRGEHMIAQHTHIVDKLVAANAGAADAPAH
jgi:putative membrane protein